MKKNKYLSSQKRIFLSLFYKHVLNLEMLNIRLHASTKQLFRSKTYTAFIYKLKRLWFIAM
jgi:hypothetical protein